MIGRLKGKLIEKQPPHLLVDVNGVGYEVNASMNTVYKLPECNQEVVLYTQLIIRDDAHLIFGFCDKQERGLFRSLIKVNGVGPKMALAILSSMDPVAFVACIENHDVKSLTRIPGVGKKTAERLIVEMADRLSHVEINLAARNASKISSSGQQTVSDAIGALIALGYKPAEASRAVSGVEAEGLSSEQLIRLSLQQFAEA